LYGHIGLTDSTLYSWFDVKILKRAIRLVGGFAKKKL